MSEAKDRGRPGSPRLHQKLCLESADILRGKPLPRKAMEARSERVIRMNLSQILRRRYEKYVRWKRNEMALLGKLPDAEAAALMGRSETAVLMRQTKLDIPTLAGTNDLFRQKTDFGQKTDVLATDRTVS